MRKLLYLVALLLFTPLLAVAAQMPLLNKVTYQMTAEKWAQTHSAKVTVTVDASLDKMDLAAANDRIMQKLKKIKDNVDWNITVFNRTQDKSGLEQLHVEAEARIPESQLGDLRDRAKRITKPGETYQIAAIDFAPSLAEMQQTRADLRQKIYNQAKQEVARLNQTFPGQHYFLYAIEFSTAPGPMPMANKMYMGVSAMAIQGSEGNAASLQVSANIIVSAVITIASQTQLASTKVEQ